MKIVIEKKKGNESIAFRDLPTGTYLGKLSVSDDIEYLVMIIYDGIILLEIHPAVTYRFNSIVSSMSRKSGDMFHEWREVEITDLTVREKV